MFISIILESIHFCSFQLFLHIWKSGPWNIGEYLCYWIRGQILSFLLYIPKPNSYIIVHANSVVEEPNSNKTEKQNNHWQILGGLWKLLNVVIVWKYSIYCY